MKIAEMEAGHDAYTSLEDKIRTMVAGRDFPAVFSVCVASFPHVVPAIKYRKQRGIEPETPDFLSFSVICKYAPLLFEHAAIASLSEFIKATRQLARDESGYLQMVENAIDRERIARLIWNYVEQHPAPLQRDVAGQIAVGQEVVIDTLQMWEKLGLILRTHESNTFRLAFWTRPESEAEGICRGCGVRGRGLKERFWKPIKCQRCGTEGYYHIDYGDFRQQAK